MTRSGSSPGSRFYAAFRKLRYLARRGTLFTLPPQDGHVKAGFPKGTFALISVNSFFLFLLAYLIIYMLHLFVTAFVAKLFDVQVYIFFNEVDFLIRGIDWTTDMVMGVFSAGPILMLVLAIFLLILYVRVASEPGILRLLLLWMIFHALTRFFGDILVGSLMGRGFGFVILYMFVMDTAKVIISITVFVAMFSCGLFMFQFFLFTANTYFNDLRRSYRLRFILNQFIYPFLLGNLAIILIKLPRIEYYDPTLNLTGILILIPLLVRSVNFQDMYFDEEPKKVSLRVRLIVITLILLAASRLMLGIGVRW